MRPAQTSAAQHASSNVNTTAGALPVMHSTQPQACSSAPSPDAAPQRPHLMLPLSFPQAQAQGSLSILCLLPCPPHSRTRVCIIRLSGPIQAGLQLVPLSLQGPAGSMGLGFRV